MTNHELTKEQLHDELQSLAWGGNANKTRMLSHDAALRASREAYKRKYAAAQHLMLDGAQKIEELRTELDEYKRKYEKVLNDAAYEKCYKILGEVEEERDALKEQALELARMVVADAEDFYQFHDCSKEDIKHAMRNDRTCQAAQRFIEEYGDE